MVITIKRAKLVSNPCSSYFSVVFMSRELLNTYIELYMDLWTNTCIRTNLQARSTHLWVPDKPVKINIWKWNSPGKLNSHHDHPCHPKEQNIMPVQTTEASINGKSWGNRRPWRRKPEIMKRQAAAKKEAMHIKGKKTTFQCN